MSNIKKLELELLKLQQEVNEIENDIISIEEIEVLDIINLAENLSKSKGARGHPLSRQEKRDAELKRRLKKNKEWIDLVKMKAEVLRDYETIRIEIDYLKREFQREMRD